MALIFFCMLAGRDVGVKLKEDCVEGSMHPHRDESVIYMGMLLSDVKLEIFFPAFP